MALQGYPLHIKVDPADELLSGGKEGVQLTWMDAKVGDWIVTPRRGKSVEINALWYNTLCTLGFLFVEMEMKEESEAYQIKAKKVLKNFNKLFWNENQNLLYDYVDGMYKNDDLRPNQIYAISLPFKLLTKDRAKKVFEAVTKHLLTPKGLRSLSPSHKDYKGSYGGGVWSRDGAYHQGTVWGFLIGPYIDALLYIQGEKGRTKATRILHQFFDHLNESGVGTVSEIFDAEPPYTSRGCIAQAWSVGEVLRLSLEHSLLIPSKKIGKSPTLN